MNLLLLEPGEISDAQVVVRGERATHIREVLRSKPGDCIRVAVVGESIGIALVLSVESERVVLGDFSLKGAGVPPQVKLIIALPRPKALRRLLQTAACFQVAHIDLINAWRVEKSYWSSPALESQALRRELWLGCEQGRHPWLPSIATHSLFMPFLERQTQKHTGAPRFLAHPGSEKWLGDEGAQSDAATFALGPEGGWIDRELASFENAGYQKISVSRSVLRSEIAMAAILSQWEMVCALAPS